MRLYGARGCGSAITEAMLAIAGQPYEFVDVGGFEQPGPARDALARINPLVQVPALVLEDGTISPRPRRSRCSSPTAIPVWRRRAARRSGPGSTAC